MLQNCVVNMFLKLFIWYCMLLWIGTTAYGKTINMVMPQSIFPCLDSYNILITSNISNNNYIKLIRIYTSFSKNENIEKLKYIQEKKLSSNNLLKIPCHTFSEHYKYYCFVFVALSSISGAVVINGVPNCRPTIRESISTTNPTTHFDTNAFAYEKLKPAGSSYKYKTVKSSGNKKGGKSIRQYQHNHKLFGDEEEEDYDESNAQSYKIICRCDQMNRNLIYSNESTVITIISLEIIVCNNNDNDNNKNNNKMIMNKNDDEKSYGSGFSNNEVESNLVTQYATICVLNLNESNYYVRVQEEKTAFPVIYVPRRGSPHLIVRDGCLQIDPRLNIKQNTELHLLKSQYLRVESFLATNISLKIILSKADSRKQEQHQQIPSLTPIHYTSLSLLLIIILSILVLAVIALTARKRKTIVRIVTPSEGNPTIISNLDRSSLSQFSFADNDSLELDFYDYLLPFVPRPQSRCISSTITCRDNDYEVT